MKHYLDMTYAERMELEKARTDWTNEHCENVADWDDNYNLSLHYMFFDRVPLNGKADHLIGEIVRAAVWIEYQASLGYYIGVDLGVEVCNPPAEFLAEHGNKAIRSALKAMDGVEDEECYKALLKVLVKRVSAYCEDLIGDEPGDFYYQHGRRYSRDEEE